MELRCEGPGRQPRCQMCFSLAGLAKDGTTRGSAVTCLLVRLDRVNVKGCTRLHRVPTFGVRVWGETKNIFVGCLTAKLFSDSSAGHTCCSSRRGQCRHCGEREREKDVYITLNVRLSLAGEDPNDFLRALAGRAPYLHAAASRSRNETTGPFNR